MSDSLAIPLRQEGESLFVGETKLPLEFVLNAYLRGFSAESIATRDLALATIYTLLAYYHQNKAAMDSYLRAHETKSEVYKPRLEETSARMGALLAARKAGR